MEERSSPQLLQQEAAGMLATSEGNTEGVSQKEALLNLLRERFEASMVGLYILFRIFLLIPKYLGLGRSW